MNLALSSGLFCIFPVTFAADYLPRYFQQINQNKNRPQNMERLVPTTQYVFSQSRFIKDFLCTLSRNS